MKDFEVAVFVERGKRGWRFSAYTRDYNPEWSGCNIMHVKAQCGSAAKKEAIAHVKARMNLKSTIAPSDVAIVGEG